MINFRAITEDNFHAIIHMKRPEGEHFVSSNAYSLAQAWLYRDAGDVYPFAIYHGDEPVGFMMLDEDLEEECLIIWRIMFPVENQGRGYGSAAIGEIIRLARESGKNPISFGNGRGVRNLFENILVQQANRLAVTPDLNAEKLMALLPEDVQAAMDQEGEQ